MVARRRVAFGLFETGSRSSEQLQIDDILSNSIIKEVFGSRVPDRDFKLGAAGELYVFEYIKGLNLPGFGLDNWKSAIRNRVSIHPEYEGIVNHSDRTAIADIEYADEQGVLTNFLIQRGYLAPTTWRNKQPNYHIEVKSTHSENWQEPFYLSKKQELHVRSHNFGENETSANVYIICRLFNVGRGKLTGFNIYVNPESCRRKGQLEFTPYTWAVKPLNHTARDLSRGNEQSTNSTEDSSRPAGIAFQSGFFSPFAGPSFGASDISTPLANRDLFGNSTASTSSLFGKSSSAFGSGLFGDSASSQNPLANKANASTSHSKSTTEGTGLFNNPSFLGAGVFGTAAPTGSRPSSAFHAPSSGFSVVSQSPSGGLFGASNTPGNNPFHQSTFFGGVASGASMPSGSGLFSIPKSSSEMGPRNAATPSSRGLLGASSLSPSAARDFGSSPMSEPSFTFTPNRDPSPAPQSNDTDPLPITTLGASKRPYCEIDPPAYYQAITALKAYREHSFEELRLHDYQSGLKWNASSPSPSSR